MTFTHALDGARRLPLPTIAFFAAVVYFVVLGGTNVGEQLPIFRAVNLVLGGIVVVAWVRRAREWDALDAAVVIAVLLFTVTSVLSSNQRLSLDATIQVVAFAGLFWYARRLMARERGIAALAWVFGGLCIGLVALFAVLWGGTWLEWATHTGFSSVPPLGLSLPTGVYLHRHDVALLVVMLAPALLIPIGFGRLRVLTVAVFAMIAGLLFMDGSRAVVLAMVIAAAVAAAVAVRRSGRVRLSLPKSRAGRIAAAAVALVVVVGGVAAAEPLLSRALELRTLSGRVELWSAAAAIWLADPLTGSGPGTFLFALFDTGYYDSNIFFPRNPDGAPLMVLAETGLMGALGIVVLAVGLLRTPMNRSAHAPELLFGPAAFVAAGIGAVPADFGYLVVPALVWLAAAYPATAVPERDRQSQRRLPVRAFAGVALGIVTVAAGFTVAAGEAYQSARVSIARGDAGAAAAHLRTAAALDPGFALYWRALGAVELGRADHGAARAALELAAARERRDPVTHRLAALSSVAAGDQDAARASADAARRLQATQPTQHVVDAMVARAIGDDETADRHVDRFLVAAPYVMGLPRWPEALGERRRADAATRLLDEWAGADPTLNLQPAMLAAMAQTDRQSDAVDAAMAHQPRSREALMAMFGCRLGSAATALDAATAVERAHAVYWATRLMLGRLTGEDLDDVRALASITGVNEGATEGFASSQPAESWGYRRPRLPGVDLGLGLPPPDAGFGEWLEDPRAAGAAAGVEALATCVAP